MLIINGNVVELGHSDLTEEQIESMLIVPEDLVELCSETMTTMYGDEQGNTFKFVLTQGNILKDNGRTPVYLCTQDMKMIYVTSVEKVQKQYH